MRVLGHGKRCMIATRNCVTVDKECDSPKEGVKGITEACQLIGRCDGRWGNVESLG